MAHLPGNLREGERGCRDEASLSIEAQSEGLDGAWKIS
jgi:hypothetical protein